MKIFLTAINAKYIHSNLAVYSLKAAAGKYGDQIEIAEYTINQQLDQILGDIYRRKPDVAAFSCYIWNMDYVEELITEYHKLCPEVPIWVGGPEVSYEVETFFAEHPQVTGVMIGEGERTFEQLCRYYVNHTGSLEEIRGFCAIADLETIKRQDYILTPGRYVGIEEQEDDGEPFEEKMARLTSELSGLFEKSHKLETEIKERLGAIGYEI